MLCLSKFNKLCFFIELQIMKLILGLVATLVAASSAKVLFEEQFGDGKFNS